MMMMCVFFHLAFHSPYLLVQLLVELEFLAQRLQSILEVHSQQRLLLELLLAAAQLLLQRIVIRSQFLRTPTQSYEVNVQPK